MMKKGALTSLLTFLLLSEAASPPPQHADASQPNSAIATDHRKHHRRRALFAFGGEKGRGAGGEMAELFQFTAHQYNLTIPENSITGTIAQPVMGTAALKIGVYMPKGYHHITFKIVEGDENQRFAATGKKLANFAFLIIELSGVDAVLNRELQSEFQLLVRATAKRRKSHTLEASTIVNLTVGDTNDNAPMFSKLDYAVQLDARTPQNSPVLRLEGFDADEGLNGELYFSPIITHSPPNSIHSSQSPWSYFYVEPNTGWVRTFTPLLSPGNYTLECLIEDRASRLSYHRNRQLMEGQHPEEGDIQMPLGFIRNRATVRIEVTTLEVPVGVWRSAMIELIPHEMDPFYAERGVFQRAATVLIPSDINLPGNIHDLTDLTLEIERVTVIGTLPSPLSDYTLALSKEGHQRGLSRILLRLERLSDAEFELGIGVLDGHDATSSREESLPVFLLPQLDLQLSLREVDLSSGHYRHQRAVLHTERVAFKPTFKPRRVWFNPETIPANGELHVNESTPAGSALRRFEAETSYPNEDGGRIRYRIEVAHSPKASLPFAIDERSGRLYVREHLLSAPISFNVIVTAQLVDGPSWHRLTPPLLLPSQVPSINFTIAIVGSNNNCPVFHADSLPPDFEVRLKSRNASEEPIFKPRVFDNDTGDNGIVMFKLLGSRELDDYFRIDEGTGEVRLVTSLPETKERWGLKILAMDLGWPLSHQTQLSLDIIVGGSGNSTKRNTHVLSSCSLPNLHAPVFQEDTDAALWSVNEDAAIGTIIGVVRATDMDIGFNGLVQYTLEEGQSSDANAFAVGLWSGELSVQSSLTPLVQRYRTNLLHSKSNPLLVSTMEMELHVMAQDSALGTEKRKSAKRSIKVRIHGSNIHAPIFGKSHYRVTVKENNALGMEILKVQASDADIGQNGKVEYALAIDTAGMLSIDPDSGVLRLDRSLDREQLSADGSRLVSHHRHVLLMASDRGSPPRASFTNVTIEVEDVNDNAPICIHHPHQKAHVWEDAPNGQLVNCLAATDWDAGDNALLNYSAIAGDGMEILRMDVRSGCLFLNISEPLNYQQKSVYRLTVEVTDNGSPPLSTNCTVEVRLLDVDQNQYPPQFSEVALEASVEENLPAGTEVVRVKAVDPEGAPVYYQLVGGSGLGHFSIDAASGAVKTENELDYELAAYYWLTVKATDKGTSATLLHSHMQLLIRVLNVNDHPPMFSQAMYYTRVEENSPEGRSVLRVEATDQDGAASAKGTTSGVKYAITRGNPQSNFVIGEDDGHLMTGKRRLDRETQSEYELEVRACDQGQPQLCSTTIVVVEVSDQNDNAPHFPLLPPGQKSASVDVPAAKSGEPLARVIAYDVDERGPNSEIEYSLVDSSSDFSIDQHGRIATTLPLKAGEKRTLHVRAADKGQPLPRASEMEVSLTAVAGPTKGASRANKKPRLLEKDLWQELFVSDSDQVGTAVGVIRAIDEDGDPLWWQIDDATNPNMTFNLQAGTAVRPRGKEATAELVLARPISSLNASLNAITLTFTIADGIHVVRDSLKLRVSHSSGFSRPKFGNDAVTVELPTSSSIPPGFLLYSPQVVLNNDEAVTSGISHPHRVVYGLHAVSDIRFEEMIRVEPSTGSVVAVKEFGGITNPTKNFSVVLSAKVGGKEALVTVHFRRKLANDHSPRFLLTEQVITIDERAKAGDVVGSAKAFDSDPGEDGAVSYAIIGGNEAGMFAIDAATGGLMLERSLVGLRSFDATLIVRASDRALVPRSTTCAIRILRLDANADSTDRMEALTTIRVSPIDSPAERTLLPPVHLSLSLSSNIAPFPITYAFSEPALCDSLDVHFVTGKLNRRRHSRPHYFPLNCTVLASLEGRIVGAFSLLLQPTTAWNQQLRFMQSAYSASISENALQGTLLPLDDGFSLAPFSTETASISDGESIKYRIQPFHRETHFAIDPTSGVMSSVVPLDYETQKSWEFYLLAEVAARSSGFAELSFTSLPSLVKINVTDVNDMAPFFPPSTGQSYQFQLYIPPAIRGMVIGVIKAEDPDETGSLRYSLRQGSKLFEIDSRSGVLSVATNDSKALNAGAIHKLDVIATDGFHSVEQKIVVEVVNRSSLSLGFSRDNYALSMRENTTDVRRRMLSLWPVGARLGENFRYRLITPHSSFAIDERSGILTSNPHIYPLDRERDSKVELMVEASSVGHGERDRRAVATVTIDLEDINDCAPLFTAASYFGTISTAVKLGDRLLSLKAIDDDMGMNGVVRYKLGVDAPPLVEVNKYDGRLSVASPLSLDAFKLGEELNFDVIAEDLGAPSLSSRAKVTLRVVDQNQPTFSHLRYTAKVSEAAAPGTALIHVRAHSGSNGVIHYRLIGGDPRRCFAIDSTTGQLSVNAQLDRELQSNYTLAIEAIDVTRENVSSRCSVDVVVEDVNDSPPMFSRELYNFSLVETAHLGTLVGQLEAFDPDIVPANENLLSYSILSGNRSVLSLDPATGSVYIASQLDFENRTFYDFVVGCADQDRLASSALLQLHVTDANDNAPRLRQSGTITHVVASNFSQDVLPLFVYQFGSDDVSDVDTVSNLPGGQPFTFRIHRGDQSLFQIGDISGLLTIIRPLDPAELEELTSDSGATRALNVSISDGLFTIYAPIEISLKPVGSVVRPLQFGKNSYRVPFAENRPPTNESAIVVVSASGGHQPLRYHIAGGHSSASLVSVNPASGKVALLRRMDTEERRLPSLQIPLMANDSEGRMAFTVLELVSVEENDNKPEWIASRSGYSLCLPSGVPEAGPLATVLAVDADNGDRLEYSLVAADQGAEPSTWFDIHPTHGRLSLKNTSSEMGRGTVRFRVRVTDSGNPPHQSDIPFEVKLLKGSAAIPHFSQLRYLFAISEGYEVGKVVGRLQPSEQTIQGLQRVKFSIVSSSASPSHGDTFDVEVRSGDIILKQPLDYEHKREHNFVAQIMNSEGAYTFCIVTVSVMDVNDNAPKFTTHYSVLNVREDAPAGTVVAIYKGRDADGDGPNSRLRYSIEHAEDAFTVDADYGWLLVAKAGLDRERRATYHLRVCVSDEPGMSTCQNTTVNVLDVNDHPPEFEKSLYDVETDAMTISTNSTLIGLRVRDRDLEPNMLRLFISSGNEDGAFGIGAEGTLVARRISLVSSRLLTVIAFDGTNTGRTEVNVTYKGEPNRSSCIGVETLPKLTIWGNLSLGETIYSLPVTDSIGRPFFNHLADYSQLPFKLLNNSNITTSEGYHKRLDYTLRIRSRHEFAESCVRLLPIHVLNSNRMAPLLERREFAVALKEDTVIPSGQVHFIMKLEARDDDAGDYGRLTYVIDTSGGVKGLRRIFDYFSLDEDTGVLSLKQPVDREEHNRFSIPVVVMDGGGLNTSTTINVEVLDVNDNVPAFKESIYRLKVLENEAVGYRLLRVEAEDADANSTVTYKWGREVSMEMKKLVKLDERTGEITLLSQLDYEQLKELKLTVVATDSGEPPLSSMTGIEVEILDENDNPPHFQKSLYQGEVVEGTEVGARILQVTAEDKDSEHFGKVSYSVVETDSNDGDYFSISDDGWLMLAKPLDYERVKRLQLNVRALDGGSPALADEATVRIQVIDVNDNAPEFAVCNMTAIIQEGVPPGQSLLTVSLTDADSIENGGPFRLELHGNGSTYFAFDPLYNLITTRQISFAEGKEYPLKVRAYDVGGRWSECPLTIFVKQSSKHAPEVEPLTVTLNTLMGEYLGGEMGAVHASDKDPADTLRFGIITPSTVGVTDMQILASKFSVDAESGVITAPGDLLPGLHRFNVSVTDGKYQVAALVTVDVTSIDADAIDHSLSVQMRPASPEKFIRSHLSKFQTAIADAVGVPATGVRLLSIQRESRPVEEPTGTMDLDVLLAVTRGESRGYHRPSFVKQRLESRIAEVEASVGLQLVSLTSEVCRRDSCIQGECRDRLWFDNTPSGMGSVQADTTVFLAPRHQRTFECACRSGYSGRHCDVPVNRCSKELCMKFEMCVPAEDEPTGFLCLCPPGSKGERCQESSCPDPNLCSIKEELSVLGNGYFQLTISTSIEAKLDLALRFKTLGESGVLMHGQGLHDYHTIQIVDGHIEYRWDCGSGEAVTKIANERVDDGKWHHLRVNRRGRHATISLDDTHRSEATSPPGSDVVNLYQHATVLTFGAKVTQSATLQPNFHSPNHPIRQHHHREQASELQSVIETGLVGCIGEIALDGYGLSKTEQGLYLHNAAIGCDASRMGPCLRVPCQHQGQCVPNRTANSYSCKCSTRYTGTNCEVDLNACMSNPCPAGIPCHNLYNDFHCSCPMGFTGKRCNLRGDWDPCVTKPCGPYGICHQQGSSFTCTCSPGYRGDFCSEKVADSAANSLFGLSVFEASIMAALLVIVLLLTGLILYVCRKHLLSHSSSSMSRSLKSTQLNGSTGDRRRRKRKERVQKGDGGAGNPLVVPRETPAPALGGTNDRPPPPLPPKFSKGPQGLLYTNLAHFRTPNAGASIGASGLPTVEVRPIQQQQIGQSSRPVAPPHQGMNSPCCLSPLLMKTSSEAQNCRHSHHQLQQNDRHNHHRFSRQNNHDGRNRGSQRSLYSHHHHHRYPSSSTENEASSDDVLRQFGQRIHRHRTDGNVCTAKAVCGSSTSMAMPPANSSTRGRNGGGISDSIQCLRHHASEDQLAVPQPERPTDAGEKPSAEYITMKPVHRANPFRVANVVGVKDYSKDKNNNKEDSHAEPAPPPPLHRTPKLQQRKEKEAEEAAQPTSSSTNPLYDNPNNDNGDAAGGGETLPNNSNHPQAFEDIDAD